MDVDDSYFLEPAPRPFLSLGYQGMFTQDRFGEEETDDSSSSGSSSSSNNDDDSTVQSMSSEQLIKSNSVMSDMSLASHATSRSPFRLVKDGRPTVATSPLRMTLGPEVHDETDVNINSLSVNTSVDSENVDSIPSSSRKQLTKVSHSDKLPSRAPRIRASTHSMPKSATEGSKLSTRAASEGNSLRMSERAVSIDYPMLRRWLYNLADSITADMPEDQIEERESLMASLARQEQDKLDEWNSLVAFKIDKMRTDISLLKRQQRKEVKELQADLESESIPSKFAARQIADLNRQHLSALRYLKNTRHREILEFMFRAAAKSKSRQIANLDEIRAWDMTHVATRNRRLSYDAISNSAGRPRRSSDARIACELIRFAYKEGRRLLDNFYSDQDTILRVIDEGLRSTWA